MIASMRLAGIAVSAELRALLGREIQRRRRERGEAWDKLDRVLDMRVANSERSPETTPRPHQHGI